MYIVIPSRDLYLKWNDDLRDFKDVIGDTVTRLYVAGWEPGNSEDRYLLLETLHSLVEDSVWLQLDRAQCSGQFARAVKELFERLYYMIEFALKGYVDRLMILSGLHHYGWVGSDMVVWADLSSLKT